MIKTKTTQAKIIFDILSDICNFALFDDTIVDFKTGMKISLLEEGSFSDGGKGLEGEYLSVEYDDLHKLISIPDNLFVLFIENLIEYYSKIHDEPIDDTRFMFHELIDKYMIDNNYHPLFENID